MAAAVRTKRPAPMIPPMPSAIRLIGPNERLRLCSPTSCASAIRRSSDFFANRLAMFRYCSCGRCVACLRNYSAAAASAARVCCPPEKINRHASEHDNQARPCRGRLVGEEHEENHGSADDVERGDDWVTKRFIWPFRIGPFPAQQKQTGDRQNVKNERSRDYIVEEVAIKIPVTGHIAAGIGFDRPRKNKCPGPNSLDDQSPGRNMVLV